MRKARNGCSWLPSQELAETYAAEVLSMMYCQLLTKPLSRVPPTGDAKTIQHSGSEDLYALWVDIRTEQNHHQRPIF
jgi:hypothetical protein